METASEVKKESSRSISGFFHDVINGSGKVGEYIYDIVNNTFYNNGTGSSASGLNLDGTNSLVILIANNTFSDHTDYAVTSSTDKTGRYNIVLRHNNAYNNTDGTYNNVPSCGSCYTLDPQFDDAANGDFDIGENLKEKGFPGSFKYAGGTGYLDLGAIQRVEPE